MGAPVDPRVESIRLLRSIDTTLKALLLVMSEKRTDAPPAVIANDADLDGQYGNPEVRAKDPRDWTGEPMKGRRFSECPAEYLDMLAARFDFFAGQESDSKKAGYCRKDAARARGWAKRMREGRVPPVVAAAAASDADGWGDEFPPTDGLPGDWR
jgi:hypothetical protein